MLFADYQGVTTYEPTWLHVAILIGGTMILTYPASLSLAALGIISNNRGALRRANAIARSQVMPGFIAYILCTVVCLLGLVVVTIIGGLLVMLNVMEPVKSVLSWPFLAFAAIVHLVGQLTAWVAAIRLTD